MRMRKSRQRLIVVASAAVVLAAALGLAAVGLRSSAAFFRTPTDLRAEGQQPGTTVRVGGLVVVGSVSTADGGVNIFTLADDAGGSIEVEYVGQLPNLFRPGQCTIATGALGPDGRFIATQVLAKHDEEYRAPEITTEPRLARSCGDARRRATS